MQLNKVISEVIKLPPGPKVLPKLQALLRDPQSGLEDIVKLLRVDVSLTANILKLVNSTHFGLASPAQGLDEAVSLLGFREVFKVASIAAAKDVMNEALPFYNAKEGELLRNSIGAAHIMTVISDALSMRGSEYYYTSGLLHGIGKIVINQFFQKRGLGVYSGHEGVQGTTHEVSIEDEIAIFGFDHAEAGAALLLSWNFPDDIVIPIRCQHAPEKSVSHRTIATALSFSRRMAVVFNQEETDPENWIIPDSGLENIGLDSSTTTGILTKAYSDYQEVERMLES